MVLFNHMSNARAAAMELLAAMIDPPAEPPPPTQPFAWTGRFIEPDSGLAVRLEMAEGRRLRMNYDRGPEFLTTDGVDAAHGASSKLRAEADGIWMDRASENQSTRLVPCPGQPSRDIEGVYHSPELDCDFTIATAGGAMYAAFSGDLGQGAMLSLQPFGPDTWLMPCPRALDHSAPGDWTVRIQRDGGGKASGLRLGCWLARDIEYVLK